MILNNGSVDSQGCVLDYLGAYSTNETPMKEIAKFLSRGPMYATKLEQEKTPPW